MGQAEPPEEYVSFCLRGIEDGRVWEGMVIVVLGRQVRAEQGRAGQSRDQDLRQHRKNTLENGPGPPQAKGPGPPATAEEGQPFALAQDDQSELAVGKPAEAYHELHAAESVTVGVGCALVQLCQLEFVVQSPLLLPCPRHWPPGPPDHEPEVGVFLPLVALKVACWDAVGVWPALAQPCAMTW